MKGIWLCMCIGVVVHPGLSQIMEGSVDYSGMADDDRANSGDELITPGAEAVDGETSISPSAAVDINVGTVPPFILPIWDPSKVKLHLYFSILDYYFFVARMMRMSLLEHRQK